MAGVSGSRGGIHLGKEADVVGRHGGQPTSQQVAWAGLRERPPRFFPPDAGSASAPSPRRRPATPGARVVSGQLAPGQAGRGDCTTGRPRRPPVDVAGFPARASTAAGTAWRGRAERPRCGEEPEAARHCGLTRSTLLPQQCQNAPQRLDQDRPLERTRSPNWILPGIKHRKGSLSPGQPVSISLGSLF